MNRPIKRSISAKIFGEIWSLWINPAELGLYHNVNLGTFISDFFKARNENISSNQTEKYVKHARNLYIRYRSNWFFEYLK